MRLPVALLALAPPYAAASSCTTAPPSKRAITWARRHTPLDIAELRADPQILAMLRRKKARHGVPASVEYDFEASGPAEAASAS